MALGGCLFSPALAVLLRPVLKQAILEKYRKLGATDKNVTVGPQWTDDRICRENCEKLLARLLLKHWNQSWDPKALAMGLARGMAGKGSSKVEDTQASKLERVIAQVS